jgi:hypothetical protein
VKEKNNEHSKGIMHACRVSFMIQERKEGQRTLLLLLVVFVFDIEVFGVSVEMVSCDSMLEQNLP